MAGDLTVGIRPRTGEERPNRRLAFFSGVLALMFLVLVGRLARLQIAQQQYFQRRAEVNSVRLYPLLAPRGTMYDRTGRVLVTTRPAWHVSLLVLKHNRAELEPLIQRLAPLLDMTPEEIRARIDQQAAEGRLFEPVRLRTDIDPRLHTLIEERKLELPGVFVEVQPVRDYLYGASAAHVIGFLGEISRAQLELPRYRQGGYRMGDVIGQSGIEGVFDEHLRGEKGARRVVVDARGRLVEEQGQEDPVPGHDLVLTLDAALQQVAEAALRDILVKLQEHPNPKYRSPNARAGAVVALDVRTGAVLAMASVPGFDPNLLVSDQRAEYYRSLERDPLRPMLPRAWGGTYPVGSTFKLVMAAAALEEGLIGRGQTVSCPGFYLVPGDRKRDWKEDGHGPVDVQQAIKVSCNVFFYEMARRLSRDPVTGREWRRVDPFGDWASAFGLGIPTGFQLPGEAVGIMPYEGAKARFGHPDPRWYPSEIANLGIGQGFNDYSALQMAIYTATIANGGTRYRPYLVQRIVRPGGEVVAEFGPEVMGTAGVRPDVLEEVRRGMLRAAMEPGGREGSGTAAHLFWDFPVKVAGKTGTAQAGRLDPDTGKEEQPHSWFVAFAPFENPEIAVAVVVEHGVAGSFAAAPVAREVLVQYFGLREPVTGAEEQPVTPVEVPAEPAGD